MTEHVERLVSSSELNFMVLRCRGCNTELTLNIESQEQRRFLVDARNDLVCPICAVPFDSNLRDSVKKFISWRTALANANQDVLFRLVVPGPAAGSG